MGLLKPEEAAFTACAIARDVTSFDLLIEDMEAELGEAWGGLNLQDGLAYLSSSEARSLEFVTIAVDRQDEEDIAPVTALIAAAKAAGIKVILVAHDLTPVTLHKLLREGADDFAPYPLPDGALREAIARLRQPAPVAVAPTDTGAAGGARNGAIMPVFGLAGGVGASTFTVNLAWELARLGAEDGLKTCILDLDLQFGTISTYLDLPRREAIFELLSDTGSMDEEAFRQAMLSFNDRLDVLTAPADALPLDLLASEDVDRLLGQAVAMYDFVFIDMPTTLVQWTETILQRADVFFALLELDLRSAQNALRFIRLLKAEDLPFEKIRYGLNRAPKFTDLSARSRLKRLADNLNIEIELQLPDGGRQVAEAGDHGLPLSETAPKNPLRKEIAKLAASLHQIAVSDAATARKG